MAIIIALGLVWLIIAMQSFVIMFIAGLLGFGITFAKALGIALLLNLLSGVFSSN